jgi:hypothetical protein
VARSGIAAIDGMRGAPGGGQIGSERLIMPDAPGSASCPASRLVRAWYLGSGVRFRGGENFPYGFKRRAERAVPRPPSWQAPRGKLRWYGRGADPPRTRTRLSRTGARSPKMEARLKLTSNTVALSKQPG